MENNQFAIGQAVEITAHGVGGVVDGIFNDRRGTHYLIEYKDGSGAIQTRYYCADQLRAV